MAMKKRKPIISLLLSVIAPGLGQIYNGQIKKGILLYFIGLLILLTFSIIGLYFYGLIIFLIIGICWLIFVIADSVITAIKIKQIKLNNYNKWYIYLIFILIFNIIGFGSKKFFVMIKAYSIPSTTMQHTLLVGDCILVNNAAYGVRNPFTNNVWIPIGMPQRGDLAVFIFPQDRTKDYIKRVAGLPGDRIQIVNKKVLVNGKLFEPSGTVYDDPTIIPAPRGPGESARDNMGPVAVPANSYFVLGDNRDHSYDSRFWGFVPLDNFRGKALYVYLSRDQKNSRIRWERIGKTIN
jgi:signal peptidase I